MDTIPLLVLYTIGYGGRAPSEFVRLLLRHGIRTIVDVRRNPHRASMGCYVKAKTPDKGVERLLSEAGIAYLSLPELGNTFMSEEDWWERYRRHIQAEGEALLARLEHVERPFCLM